MAPINIVEQIAKPILQGLHSASDPFKTMAERGFSQPDMTRALQRISAGLADPRQTGGIAYDYTPNLSTFPGEALGLNEANLFSAIAADSKPTAAAPGIVARKASRRKGKAVKKPAKKKHTPVRKQKASASPVRVKKKAKKKKAKKKKPTKNNKTEGKPIGTKKAPPKR